MGRTEVQFEAAGKLWQTPLPESRNVFPSSGMNSQVYFPGARVKLQHAEGLPISHFAVRGGKAKQAVAAPARPSDNFADAVFRVGLSVRVLWREPLVGMFMPRQNKVGVRRVKVFPELLQFRMPRVALEESAAEQRMVTIGEYASVGVLREVLLQPGVLRRACVAAPQAPGAAIRIQHDDVPNAQIIAVVALTRRPGLRTPIAEIARCRRFHILVVSESRLYPVFEASPGWVIAIPEIFRTSFFVSQIARCKDCPWNLFDKFSGRLGAFRILATGDVSCADQDERLLPQSLITRFARSAFGSIDRRLFWGLRPTSHREEEEQQERSPHQRHLQRFPVSDVSLHP